jgi:hypothetical protein
MGQRLFVALFRGSLIEAVLTTVGATFFDPFPDSFDVDIHFHSSTRCDIDIDRVTAARVTIHARTVALDIHPHATPSRIDRHLREMGAAGIVPVFEIPLGDGRIDLDASAAVTAGQEHGQGTARDDRKCAFHGMSFEKTKKPASSKTQGSAITPAYSSAEASASRIPRHSVFRLHSTREC